MENIVNSTIALYKAYRKTRCGKRDNPTAMRYRMEAIERTVALSERLLICFFVVIQYFIITILL